MSDLNRSKKNIEIYESFNFRSEAEKAQAYLKIAEVIIVVIRSDETIELLNKKGCEVLGANESDVVGKNWFDNFIPEENRKEIRKVFRKLMKGEMERFEYFENYVITTKGEQRLIAWHNGYITDEKGNIVSTISFYFDISNRARRQSNSTLGEFNYRCSPRGCQIT